MTGRRETFGEHIARRRKALGLSQEGLATALHVTRTTVSNWERGQQRPTPGQLDELTRVLEDDGRLASLARYDDGDRPPLIDPPIRVGDLCRRIGDALIGLLSTEIVAGDGPGYGWCRDVDELDQPPSAWATAFGLRAVMRARGLDHRVSLPQVRATIRRLELPSKGWGTRGLGAIARPEVTAVVVAALHEAGEDDVFIADRVRLVVEMLDSGTSGAEAPRPFVLATALIELSRLGLDEAVGRSLVETLVDLSQPDGEVRGWPTVVRESAFGPRPSSTVHTAVSVCAIAAWADRLGDARLAEVARAGSRWLERYADLDLDDEVLHRPRSDGGFDSLPIRHFTSAWVAQAALATGADSEATLVDLAMRDVISAYRPELGIWHWRRGGGEYPIWMTYHGVVALKAWALSRKLA